MKDDLCALAKVAAIESGAGFPLDRQGECDGEYPFLKVSDMNLPGNERSIHSWNNTVTDAVRRELRAKAFPAGSIIFPKIGAAIATNKKRVLTRPSCVDNNVMAVTPVAERLEPDYLYYLLLQKNLSDFASASNPPSIKKTEVEGWHVRVPPLDVQRRIVDVLTRAEGIVRLRREAHAKAAELVPALFLDMFGDPASNPKGWPVVALGELVIDGPQNGLYKHKSFYGGGTPILRIDGFYDGAVLDLSSLQRVRLAPEEIERYALTANDLVINRVNSPEYLGKSALIPALHEPTVFESNMMRLRLDETHAMPGFIIQSLQTEDLRMQVLASAKHAINQSSINQQDVRALRVLLPPIDLQRQFTTKVDAVSAIIVQQDHALDKAQATFDVLLQQAFARP